MSASGPDSPPTDPHLLAILAAVAWVATVVALFGFLSLLLDLEVIPDAAAGPLLAPSMVVIAAIVLTILLLRIQRRRTGAGPALIGGAFWVYVTMLVVGAVGYSAGTGDPAQLLFFVLRYGVSPFIGGAAVLAGVVALGVVGASARAGKGGRPRWPWEDRDEP